MGVRFGLAVIFLFESELVGVCGGLFVVESELEACFLRMVFGLVGCLHVGDR